MAGIVGARTSPSLAALASAVLPGLGQWLAGHRRRGGYVFVVFAGITIGGMAFVLTNRTEVALWWVQPTALRWMLVGNGLVLAARVAASVDAYLVAEGTETRAVKIAALALGAIVLVAPHWFFTERDLAAARVLTIFPTTTSTTTTTTTTTLAPTTSLAAGGSSTTSSSTTTTTTTSPPPPPRLWDGVSRLNIALLGGDAGVGRRGVRTDTLMVVSVDPETGDTALFQVPRNMARVPMPEDSVDTRCECFRPIVNELWQYGERNPDRFPTAEFPGAEAVKAGLGELLGIDVHHFIMVNLDGFVAMIDALGGVDIVVTERVYDSNYPNEDGTREVVDIQPGEYHMDGHLALAYSRSRQRSDDYNRMGRQSCMVRSVVDQTDPLEVLLAFPTLADIIAENVITDIPLNRVPDLIALLSRVDLDRTITIAMNPPTYTGPRTSQGYNTPDLDAIRGAVETATSMPADAARSALGIDDSEETC